MDRIEFEELSLKSMDPSLGPRLSSFGKPGVEIEKRDPLVCFLSLQNTTLFCSPFKLTEPCWAFQDTFASSYNGREETVSFAPSSGSYQ